MVVAIYDYRCPECSTVETVQHSVNDTPLIECEACNRVMNKVYFAPGTVFPGEGWGKDAR